MPTDKQIETPRLSIAQIDEAIVAEEYAVLGGRLTVCCLTLRNGALVTGECAPVSQANFDAEVGRKIAKDMAREKVWMLESYLLRERLHRHAKAA